MHQATEVNVKLVAAAQTRTDINEKREQYRPVATRGSVLYFSIVSTSLVNVMYQVRCSKFCGSVTDDPPRFPSFLTRDLTLNLALALAPQTSLDQFQTLFDNAMDAAEKASLAAVRVNNIIDTLTYVGGYQVDSQEGEQKAHL